MAFSKEASLAWNTWIRQVHRWLSVMFVASVIGTTIALAQKPPLVWVSYVPLLPLALLSITGIYLFALPYVGRRRQAEQGLR